MTKAGVGEGMYGKSSAADGQTRSSNGNDLVKPVFTSYCFRYWLYGHKEKDCKQKNVRTQPV